MERNAGLGQVPDDKMLIKSSHHFISVRERSEKMTVEISEEEKGLEFCKGHEDSNDIQIMDPNA